MNFTLYAQLIYGTSILTLLGLSAITLFSKRNKTTFFFVGTLVALLGWVLTLFLLYNTSRPEFLGLIGRLNFAFATLFPGLIYIFSQNFPFPTKEPKTLRVEKYILIWSSIFSAISLFTDFVVKNETITSTGNVVTEYGLLYPLFLIHFILFLFLTLRNIVNNNHDKNPKINAQKRVLFWGILLSLLWGTTTNIIVPAIFDTTNLIPINVYIFIQNIGVLAVPLLGVPIVYAIVRFQFLDSRVLAGKVIYYSILATFSYFMFLGITIIELFAFESVFSTQALLTGVFLAFTFAFMFDTIGSWLNARINKTLINPFYDMRLVIKDYNDKIANILEFDKLFEITSEVIKKILVGENTFELLIFKRTEEEKDSYYGDSLSPDKKIFEPMNQYVNDKHVFPLLLDRYKVEPEMAETYPDLMPIIDWMMENDISVLAPMIKDDGIIGLLLLGRKENASMYTSIDGDLINDLATSLSWAIDRSFLYKEVASFNKVLREKVDKATKDLRQSNTQLETALAELKTLDQAKSEFISIASHQLRTPISIIRGYISMILDGDFGPIPDEQRTMLGKTQTGVKQLVNIVEDILNASRIEQGRLVITPEPFDIVEAAKTVTNELNQKASRKGLDLSFESKETAIIVNADKNKLFEVMMNLVDNALNYTKEGSVSVKLEDLNDRILFSVKDTGIGIPEDSKDKIFRRFSRLDNAKKVRPDGTGIGLYIAKTIVDAHKGKIWFESTAGVGTTFQFELFKQLPAGTIPDSDDK